MSRLTLGGSSMLIPRYQPGPAGSILPGSSRPAACFLADALGWLVDAFG